MKIYKEHKLAEEMKNVERESNNIANKRSSRLTGILGKLLKRQGVNAEIIE